MGELESLGVDEAGAFRVIYPADVLDAKNRIEAKMLSVGRDVAACPALPAADQKAWSDFYAAWRRFFCRNDTGECTEPDYALLGLGGQYDDCETWEAQLFAWQKKIDAAACKLSAPLSPPPTPTIQQTDPSLVAAGGIVQDLTVLALVVAGVWVVQQSGVLTWIPRKGGKR
jgi:hypothetical protein